MLQSLHFVIAWVSYEKRHEVDIGLPNLGVSTRDGALEADVEASIAKDGGIRRDCVRNERFEAGVDERVIAAIANRHCGAV
jgi:hypothetical protein